MYIFNVSVGGKIKVGQSFILSLLMCLFSEFIEGGIEEKIESKKFSNREKREE